MGLPVRDSQNGGGPSTGGGGTPRFWCHRSPVTGPGHAEDAECLPCEGKQPRGTKCMSKEECDATCKPKPPTPPPTWRCVDGGCAIRLDGTPVPFKVCEECPPGANCPYRSKEECERNCTGYAGSDMCLASAALQHDNARSVRPAQSASRLPSVSLAAVPQSSSQANAALSRGAFDLSSASSSVRLSQGFGFTSSGGFAAKCACESGFEWQKQGEHPCGCGPMGSQCTPTITMAIRQGSNSCRPSSTHGCGVAMGFSSFGGGASNSESHLASAARAGECMQQNCCCCVDSLVGTEKGKPKIIQNFPLPQPGGGLVPTPRLVGWYHIDIALSSYPTQDFRECQFELLEAKPLHPGGPLRWEDYMLTHAGEVGVTFRISQYLKRAVKCPINETVVSVDRPNLDPANAAWLDAYGGVFWFLHRVVVRSGKDCDKCRFSECALVYRVIQLGGTGRASSMVIIPEDSQCAVTSRPSWA